MTVIVGILAVGADAKLLTKDEEDGVLELILSYPAGRSGIFWGIVGWQLFTVGPGQYQFWPGEDFWNHSPPYLSGGKAISGLNTDWLVVLAELVVLFLLLSWYIFLTRDIRVT